MSEAVRARRRWLARFFGGQIIGEAKVWLIEGASTS
jgi:hypothetical protein